MDVSAGKSSKKPVVTLRMVVLLFAMTFGVYICSICFNQISSRIPPQYALFPILCVTEERCEKPYVSAEDVIYVHFPLPKTYDRGECACSPVRFFVILSMQRSGSGWFETLLNSHPNVSSNGEIFSVKERRGNFSTIQSTLDKVYNLEWVSSSAKNECVAAVGFKWMLNQAEVLAKYRPVINTESLLANLKSVEKMMEDSLKLFNSTRHLVVYYENVTNNEKELSLVQKFLGVPVRKLKSRQVKIHIQPSAQQIENWADVQKVLKGTEYDHFLENADYST